MMRFPCDHGQFAVMVQLRHAVRIRQGDRVVLIPVKDQDGIPEPVRGVLHPDRLRDADVVPVQGEAFDRGQGVRNVIRIDPLPQEVSVPVRGE